MTSEGLGEMFECDFADTCTETFPLVSMGGQADPSSVQGHRARINIGVSKNLFTIISVGFLRWRII